MNGILNVYKEKGYTSHDVVARLRGILKIKKIGHTGTLDPEAEGVLPVCIGKATKLCDFMTEKDKEYEVVMRLGVRTDTCDMTGSVISECRYEGNKDELIDVIGSFVGKNEQIPPMYSALKVNGKKLYELARMGKEVERKPRPVTIHRIVIEDISIESTPQTVKFKTLVSKGTYIRTLCQDIGEKLGCGACMQELVRTSSGVFTIDDAIKLDEIEKLTLDGVIDDRLIKIEDVFSMKCVIMKSSYDKLVSNGNKITPDMFMPYAKTETGEAFINTGTDDICVYYSGGSFAGVYRKTDEDSYKVYSLLFQEG